MHNVEGNSNRGMQIAAKQERGLLLLYCLLRKRGDTCPLSSVAGLVLLPSPDISFIFIVLAVNSSGGAGAGADEALS